MHGSKKKLQEQVANPAPNKSLQPTPDSVRSASAPRRG
jgi:hypothetical protein